MTSKDCHVVYLGLGSNLGNSQEQLGRACEKINKLIGPIVRQSAFYETEPWGFQSENNFLNAVVCVSTHLSPRQLLRATQRIERQLGKRKAHATERGSQTSVEQASSCEKTCETVAPVYHDRPIDIDILLYDDLHVDEPDLKIPHPLMQERDFVMVPIREIISQ